MAFERKNFLVAKKAALPKGEFVVECNLAAGAMVQKVLAVAVEPCVQSKEVLDGVINYGGAIDVKVVFLTEEGEINTITSSCPFSSKFESEQIVANACAKITIDLIDSTCELQGGENIKIIASMSQYGFVVCSASVANLRCDDEDVCWQSEEMEIIKFLGCAADKATAESEITIRDGIKKILLVESSAVVKAAEGGANYVALSGDVVSKVLYINENDKFESGYIYDSFKQEVELAGTTHDSLVEGYVAICQEQVVTEIMQDEKGTKLVVKVPLNFSVFAYEKESVSVIRDLYGTKAAINLTTESFDMSTLCPIEIVEGKVEGSLTIDEDKPRVDKILFNGASRVSLTNYYIDDGELFVEGIAQTTVVYLNDDTSSLQSAVIDVPFVLNERTSCDLGSLISVSAIICDADVVVKKGRELLFDAKIKASVVCSCRQSNAVISNASVGEEYEEKDYAMEVVFARQGQDLWETAKAARVRQEQIIAQNPEVEFPVEKDTSLILFYQRVQ